MQLRFPWSAPSVAREGRAHVLDLDGRRVPVVVAGHRWARRYLLRLLPDGRLRLTVPRGASVAGGLAFVVAEAAWVASELERQRVRATWESGQLIWFRGERVALTRTASGEIMVGDEPVLLGKGADLGAAVQAHLRSLAEAELPARCVALGRVHGLRPSRVSVRNQRSRWGACSARAAITLNWRLVQMPPIVSDYVVLHELAHLEHPNHARRFWRKVASICPEWREAERWLRRHGRELL
jgi:predicted metal-dependent hydrolase